MWNELMQYLQFPFVRYALITGILISFTSSILGVTLVLKRFAHIGDGLSHVAFGAMAAASVLKMTNQKMLVILPVTVLTAVLLLKQGRSSGNGGDAGIAMISVASLAAGYLMMNIFKTSSNVSADVCTTLFGSTSILTLTKAEVWLCVILSAAVLAIYVVMYQRIFSVTFDEDFARATGVDTEKINLLIAAASALVIVLAMNLVGSLLISALVIFPAISSMRVFKSFKSVTICSAILSVLCTLIGMIISILSGTPVGSTIVACDIVMYGVFAIVGSIAGRKAV